VTKEFVVASKKKPSKKKKTKVAAAKAATPKKRAKKGAAKKTKKAPAKKVKKAAKKPAAKKPAQKFGKQAVKKTAKKTVKKSDPKIEAKKRVETPKEASAPKKVAKPKAVRPVEIKAAASAPAPVSSRDNIFYITTAIAYPNGTPHIGHAYEAIATDALARFQRLDGKDVFFLTGTDEHGQKMVQTAESEGLAVAELAARNAGRFKEMDERLNVSFDRFIRTTEPAHHHSVQVVWNRMQQNGDIYIDTYAGWYSVRDEA